jgi:hypothetical protein
VAKCTNPKKKKKKKKKKEWPNKGGSTTPKNQKGLSNHIYIALFLKSTHSLKTTTDYQCSLQIIKYINVPPNNKKLSVSRSDKNIFNKKKLKN